MKTRFYLALAIVALSWMGCSQEEEAINELKSGVNTIYATLESATRSTVTDAGVFSWASGDQITVLDASNKDTYTYSGNGNGFDLQGGGTPTVSNAVVAYYPANESHTTTAFNLPATYGDENTEYVADTHAAMIATPPTSGNTYAFMHLGGVMRFNVKNVPAGTTEFSFTASGKKITGDFTVTDNDGVKTIATEDVAEDAAENNTVTIQFEALTEAKDMTFYVPLPTGEYGDYTVALKVDNETKEKESTNVTNTINRKSLLLMPTFSYEGSELTKSTAKVRVIDLEDGNTEADITDDADVVVTPGTDAEDADAVAKLNYTPANDGSSVLSISDGSAKGTESGESEGKVVVETNTENANVAALNINAPKLTVELSAAENTSVTYTEVTALTAQQTLIIGEGVTIKKLVLNGGNVEIEGGTVEEVENTAKKEITWTVKTTEDLYAAAKVATTIILADDIAVTNDQFVQPIDGQTYDLNTHKLYVSGGGKDVLRILTANAKVVIKNGTIENNNQSNYALSVRAAGVNLTMENVTIPATNSIYGALYCSGNDSGSTFKLMNCNFSGYVYLSNTDEKPANTLIVEGGTFTTPNDDCFILINTNAEITGATLTNTLAEQVYQDSGNEGNAFTNVDGYCIAFPNTSGKPGKGSVILRNNTYNIADTDGTYIYNQLNGAEITMSVDTENELYAATVGSEIILADNVTLTKPLNIVNDLTIDLGEYTITGSGISNDAVVSADSATVTIKGNGTITTTGAYPLGVKNGGKLIIEGGNFTATNSTQALYIWKGTAEIKDGSFEVDSKYNGTSYVDTNGNGKYVLNCLDAAYRDETAKFIVTGGKFYKFDPANNVAEGENTNFVAEGYTSVKNGDWYEVKEAE